MCVKTFLGASHQSTRKHHQLPGKSFVHNEEWGFGDQKLYSSEFSTAAKHIWYIPCGKACLWVRWAQGIYLKGNEFCDIQSMQNYSGYWRKILSLRARFAQGFNGGYWLPDKSRHYSISSDYKFIIGSREPWTNVLKLVLSGVNTTSQNTQSAYGGLG